MSKMGKFSAADIKKLQKQLNKIQSADMDALMESCAKELAARLLALVIKRTPVGNYTEEIEVIAKRDSKHHKKGDTYTKRVNPSGKKTSGTLRRGWTSETHEEAEKGKGSPTVQEAKAYANSLTINHTGNNFTVEIINPVKYASYVEYGHVQTPGRYVPAIGKKLKRGFVQGRFMLTISEQELETITPKVLTSKIKKYLGEYVK